MHPLYHSLINLGTEDVEDAVLFEQIRICNRITILILILGVATSIAMTPFLPIWLGLYCVASVFVISSPLLLMRSGRHKLARLSSVTLAQIAITSLLILMGPKFHLDLLYLPLIVYTILIADQSIGRLSSVSIGTSAALCLYGSFVGQSVVFIDESSDYLIIIIKLFGILWTIVLLYLFVRQLPKLNQIILSQSHTLNEHARRAALGETAEVIAHEINNPLAVIQGYTYSIGRELKKESPDFVVLNTTLEKISAAQSKLGSLIQAMRSYATAESQDHREIICVADAVNDAVTLSGSLFKDAEISLAIDPRLQEVKILGRQARLTQVFLNLLNNARDVLPREGGGKISIHLNQVLTDPERYVIDVSDNGPGLPFASFDEAAHVFRTSKSESKGTGLGLAICKKIMRQHGGSMEYERLDGFSIFQLTFPRAAS